MGDLDNNGKPDLAVANFNSDRVSVFKNTSTSGNISYAAKTDYNAGSWTNYVAINDLDGDGKLEIAFTGDDPIGTASLIHVYKNTSITGAISFSERIDYPVVGSNKIVIADFNNDGKPEMSIAGSFLRSVIYKNKTGETAISSFTPATAGTGTTVTITGENLIGATQVSFGGVPAVSFIVNSSTNITAVVGNGASGSISVTTPKGTDTLGGFIYTPPPTIDSFSPTSAATGDTVTITGSYFSNASLVSFGGVPAASFQVVNESTITGVVGTGNSGDVVVETLGGSARSGGFIYIPPPDIISFSPSTGTPGVSVTINGSGFTGSTDVRFGGIRLNHLP